MSLLDLVKIIYEDKDLLVINKPSGLLTHKVSKDDNSDTVAKWFLQYYPDAKDVYSKLGQDLEWEAMRPGIVHRLDKETSGVMVLAKNQKAFDFLKTLFQERKIKKTYLALVAGHFKERFGIIDLPIGKYGGKQTTRTVVGRSYLKEKTATTKYKVLQELQDYSLVELEPQTGRTHQIRVHLKALGHPILCDPLYSSKRTICPPELGRLFLHAQKLSFVTPEGKSLTIESDLPEELERFLEALQTAKN